MSSQARPAASPGGPGSLRRLDVARGMAIAWGSPALDQASATLHTAPGYLRLIYVRRGRCVVTLPDGSRAEAAEGDVVLLGPSVSTVGM